MEKQAPVLPVVGPLRYEASLRVRGPWQDQGGNPTRVEASVTTSILVPQSTIARCGCLKPACLACKQTGQERVVAAREQAVRVFRELGLGVLMDLEGARVAVSTVRT